MSIDANVANNSQDWDKEKLIELSNNLGKAYNPGLDNTKSDRQTDSWNANKFVKLSRFLSSAYCIDF